MLLEKARTSLIITIEQIDKFLFSITMLFFSYHLLLLGLTIPIIDPLLILDGTSLVPSKSVTD
jgi:hypothetical protein